MSDPMIARMERFEEKENWPKAIEINKQLLKKYPGSHWLYSNLSSNYHEAHKYKTALKYAEMAMELAPDCPVVLWDYAGVLDTLEMVKQARAIWQKLLRKGVKKLTKGECAESVRWTEAMLNDCRYRLGLSYAENGNKGQAKKYFKEHLKHRKPGLPSLYTMTDVKRWLKAL
jgi:tetratricopeptide (TPR) repeat protein